MKRRQHRWRKWLIISAVTLMVVLGTGYIGLNMAVDYVLKSMVAGSELDELLEQALNGDLDALFAEAGADLFDGGFVPVSTTNGWSAGVNGNGAVGPSSGDAGAVSSSSNATGNSNNSSGGSASAVGGADAGSAPSNSAADKPSYTPEITKDKVAAIQESVTLGEKMKLATVLMKRLDASDIDQFIDLMSGGMTVEEKREAKNIMLEKLTPEEYNDLIQIAAKYGLSKGKTYEESLKEKK